MKERSQTMKTYDSIMDFDADMDHHHMVENLVKDPAAIKETLTEDKVFRLVQVFRRCMIEGALLDATKKETIYGKENAVPGMIPPYISEVPGTFPDALDEQQVDLIHMIMGVVGEASELMEAVYRNAFLGEELDTENITEELGDLEFYLRKIRTICGIDRIDTINYNINKLLKGEKARYREGQYSDKAAIDRRDKQPDGKES